MHLLHISFTTQPAFKYGLNSSFLIFIAYDLQKFMEFKIKFIAFHANIFNTMHFCKAIPKTQHRKTYLIKAAGEDSKNDDLKNVDL
jgi:hypothetical protein